MRFDTIRLVLWSYAKNRVIADKPSTVEHLKPNIRQVMSEVAPNMCLKAVENNLKRINAYNILRGDHLNDVVWFTDNVNVQTSQQNRKIMTKIFYMRFIYF